MRGPDATSVARGVSSWPLVELRNGSRLGHYEITGRLGAGGMGEVYRGVDKRLDRDVKPANAMIGRSGVKPLDFGLAKLRDLLRPDALTTPQNTDPLTAEGAIVGTLQYMAPEQFEGKEADARTDIFGTPSRATEVSSSW